MKNFCKLFCAKAEHLHNVLSILGVKFKFRKKKFNKRISYLKSLYFNLHYFGLKGLKLPVLLGKNVSLLKTGGNITLDEFRYGIVTIGLNRGDIFSFETNPTVFENSGQLHFKGQAIFGIGSKLSNSGNITFGKNFFINGQSLIICVKQIDFGDKILIGWGCNIMDFDYHKILDLKDNILNEPRPIVIKDRVWICSNAAILKGSFINSDTIVAINTVISKTFNEKNIMLGGVNQIIKQNVKWKD